jgi:hypothetical protein
VELEARLQQLEHAVQQYVPRADAAEQTNSTINHANGTTATCPPLGDTLQATSQIQPHIVNGATHWSTVLDDIRDIRLAIGEDDGGLGQEDLETEPLAKEAVGIIFGTEAPWTIERVLASCMPPRKDVDRLVSAYFRSQTIAAPFIHSTSFQRQYLSFWTNPTITSPLWLSMLFSICHVSSNVISGRRENQGIDHRFSVAAARCLAIGEYFRPKQFAVESLALYAHSQCLTTLDLPSDLAPIFGILGRTATMMGYHLDPTVLGLSPYEAEMRRRLWSQVMQLDILVSFHFGLPGAIQSTMSNAEPPRNLHDSDFDEDTLELPPSRPDSEPTGILFINIKHRFIMGIFARILRHALGLRTMLNPLEDVDALDAEVKQVFAAVPDSAHPRPMSECVFDPPSVIITRLCILFIYCKCLCVLHRPHVMQLRRQSIAACYDATSLMLSMFADAYAEFAPKGQMESEGWFITSLTWNDFLLGVVTHCLAAMVGMQTTFDIVNASNTVKLLTKAREICAKELALRGKQTSRVHVLITTTLQRLEGAESEVASSLRASSLSDMGLPNGAHAGLDLNLHVPIVMDDPLWDDYLEQYLDMEGNVTKI